jgi:membrane associated rhomboid family serine protease
MIPLKDDNPRFTVPFVTVLLILANVAVFFYQVSLPQRAGQHLVMMYGMVPARVEAAFSGGSVPLGLALEPLITSMFLHSGWLHLIGNMWFLWIFSDNVEDELGHAGFLLFYMFCGVAAGVTHTIANWGSSLPAIGASGAIAGVMGAYLIFFPRAKVLTLVPLLVFFFTVRLPAIFLIGIWFLMQFFSGVGSLGTDSGGGVAWWAHIGGFTVGALIALVIRERRPKPAYY